MVAPRLKSATVPKKSEVKFVKIEPCVISQTSRETYKVYLTYGTAAGEFSVCPKAKEVEVRGVLKCLDKDDKNFALNFLEDLMNKRLSSSRCKSFLLVHRFLTDVVLKQISGWESIELKDSQMSVAWPRQ